MEKIIFSDGRIKLENWPVHLNINTNSNISFSLIKTNQLIDFCKSLNGNYLSISDYFPYDFPSFIESCLKNGIKPIISLKKVIFINDRRLLISFFPTNFKSYKILNQFIANNSTTFSSLENLLFLTNEILIVIEIDNYDSLSVFSEMRNKILTKSERERIFLGIKFTNWEYLENDHFIIPFFSIKTIYKNQIKDLFSLTKTSFLSNFSRDDFEQTPFPFNPLDFFAFFSSCQNEVLKKLFLNIERILSLISIDLPPKIKSDNNDFLLLRRKCFENLNNLEIDQSQIQRYTVVLNKELTVIKNLNFSDYFLKVDQIINQVIPREVEIGPGRGSSVSSLVAFLLGITKIDPLKNNLFFWRFLNEKRTDYPDIDTDVSDFRLVFKSIFEKYGDHRVFRIAVKKKVGWTQALESSINLFANNFVQQIYLKSPKVFLNDSLFSSGENFINENFQEVVRFAKIASEINISTSIHPSGLIILDYQNDGIFPVKKVDDFYLILYTNESLKSMSIKKYDFLSLNGSLGLIKELKEKGIKIPNFQTVDLSDQRTFKLINSRFLTGLFQIDTPSFKEIIKDFNIENFSDLVILISINRPGSSHNIQQIIAAKRNVSLGRKEFSFSFLNDLLSETYGKIVFEEQVTLLIHHCLDIELSEAEMIRKAIKKSNQQLERFKDFFIRRSQKVIEEIDQRKLILNMIVESAPYLYNKSHATSYAFLTYFGAYLKFNFSSHFFLFLTSNSSKLGNFSLLEELKFIGYKLIPPKFTVSNFNLWSFDELRMIAKIPLSYINNFQYLNLLSSFTSKGKKRDFLTLGNFISENFNSIENDQKFCQDLIDWTKIGIFDCVKGLTAGLLLREKSSIESFISFKKEIPEYFPEYLTFNHNNFEWKDSLSPINWKEKEEIEKRVFNVYLSPDFFLCLIKKITEKNSGGSFTISLWNLFLEINIPIDSTQFQSKKSFLKVGNRVFLKRHSSLEDDDEHWSLLPA